MVERLARMLDAGVLLLDPDGAPECAAGQTPDPARVQRRLAEREFEEDGWHVVSVPIGANGWLAIASRGRLTARLARPAAQAAVPLLAATERLGELARDQERAVRSALLDEALDLTQASGREVRALAARVASCGIDLAIPACVMVVAGADADALEREATTAGLPHLVTTRKDRAVALVQGGEVALAAALDGVRAGLGRPIEDIGDVPRSYRDAELAVERVREGTLAYEDFDLATLVLSEVAPEHIQPRVDELMAPLRANPPLLEALVEYFARDMDVNATAEAMHVHPNTLRYRLSRVEKLLGRSLRNPATIAELSLALLARRLATGGSAGRRARRRSTAARSTSAPGPSSQPASSHSLLTRCHGFLGQTLTQPCAAKRMGVWPGATPSGTGRPTSSSSTCSRTTSRCGACSIALAPASAASTGC